MKTIKEAAEELGYTSSGLIRKIRKMKLVLVERNRRLYIKETDVFKLKNTTNWESLRKRPLLSNDLDEMYLKLIFYYDLDKDHLIKIRSYTKKKKAENEAFDELKFIQKLYMSEDFATFEARMKRLTT
jgi:hypothetical protein